MSTRSLPPLPPLLVFTACTVCGLVAAGCAARSRDADLASDDALQASSAPDAAVSAAGVVRAASRKYAAIAGTWKALDAVPPTSADGVASYTTYTFAADGSFLASRSCRAHIGDAGVCDAPASATSNVSGTWQIFTTLPTLPRIDMTWADTRESYVFAMQADLLVLDGIDALFQHDVGSLPEVPEGAVCEDVSWNSLARCPPAIGACDHETHRCLQAS